jgi:hypothetical protein
MSNHSKNQEFFKILRKKWFFMESCIIIASAAAYSKGERGNTMGEKFDSVAPEAQNHIRRLVKTAGLEDREDSLEMLSGAWLEKQDSFFSQTKQKNMEEVESLSADDPRGALVMTYSGSLISIGPVIGDLADEDGEAVRSVDYVSIGLRNDVPESAGSEDSLLPGDVQRGHVVEFERGPIAKSSPVYAIAVFQEKLDAEEEQDQLEEVTLLLTQDFIDINKTIVKE